MFTQIKLTADAYEQPPNHYHMIEVNLVEVKGGGGAIRVFVLNNRMADCGIFCFVSQPAAPLGL